MLVEGTNLFMTRGDTEYIVVSCINEDGLDHPFIEGDIIYFTVKRSAHTENRILQKVIREFLDGDAFITINPEDTNSLRYGPYMYDVQLTEADGNITTIIPPSQFYVGEEVTYD